MRTEAHQSLFLAHPRTVTQQDLRALNIPVLALMGGKDVQAIASRNIGPYKAALASNPRARVMEMPGLNHLIQESETGAITEYAKLTQTIASKRCRRSATGWRR